MISQSAMFFLQSSVFLLASLPCTPLLFRVYVCMYVFRIICFILFVYLGSLYLLLGLLMKIWWSFRSWLCRNLDTSKGFTNVQAALHFPRTHTNSLLQRLCHSRGVPTMHSVSYLPLFHTAGATGWKVGWRQWRPIVWCPSSSSCMCFTSPTQWQAPPSYPALTHPFFLFYKLDFN